MTILHTEIHMFSQAADTEAFYTLGISERSDFIRVHTNLLDSGSQVVIFWSQTIWGWSESPSKAECDVCLFYDNLKKSLKWNNDVSLFFSKFYSLPIDHNSIGIEECASLAGSTWRWNLCAGIQCNSKHIHLRALEVTLFQVNKELRRVFTFCFY